MSLHNQALWPRREERHTPEAQIKAEASRAMAPKLVTEEYTAPALAQVTQTLSNHLPSAAEARGRRLTTRRQTTWQLLQISDVLDQEFGSALSQSVPVLAWQPEMSAFPWILREAEQPVSDPPLRIRSFPLLRRYWRFPLSAVAALGRSQVKRMKQQCDPPEETPLICTTPYYAPVAELWPGPVVYYLTDLMAAYAGANAALVRALDARMCGASTLVCPNSIRIAAYLTEEAGCRPEKIVVLPNATRESNLLSAPVQVAGNLPVEISDAPRPVAGVIGNLAGNMDWLLLKDLLGKTPEFTWVFVGPTSMEIEDVGQRHARDAVMKAANARFVGRKPYGMLAEYARSFDVAMLPYLRREPTFSGSSTRFYEHLAACRPMLATRGFEELLHKEPLLRLVDTAEEAAGAMKNLQAAGFDDGLSAERWSASKQGTWQVRARTMQEALEDRCGEAR